MRRVALWLLLAVASVLLGLAIRYFALSAARVVGGSMQGALHSGDLVLVDRLSYRLGDPARGDIALARAGGAELIKRVIGLPGEEVSLLGGGLYIGGEATPEGYLTGDAGEDYTIRLGARQYLLLGDNRYHSHDSRASDVGPVSRADVIGRVVWVLWPPGRFGPAG